MSKFTTAIGRVIHLSTLSISGTYEGYFEGSPETISRYVLKDLTTRNARSSSGRDLVLTLPTDVFPLPPFIWTAKLTSPNGVKNTDPDFYSELTVRWFADSRAFDETINEIVASKLTLFDWDQYATDIDMMNF